MAIFALIAVYSKSLYNVYLHPTLILNAEGSEELILFGDFKYIFNVIKCHNLGFDVYSSNECYRDYYGSFLYGPLILVFPSLNPDYLYFFEYLIFPSLILIFIYLTIKLINPNTLFEYLLLTLILFNPTTLFLYEKLNIDILIYIFLIIIVYYSNSNFFNFFLISCLTLIKFYPAMFSSIFLLNKINLKKKILFLFSYLILLFIFIIFFKNNLINVINTLDNVSQSFRYAFSLSSLSKIISYLLNSNSISLIKIILIFFSCLLGYIFYRSFIKSNNHSIKIHFDKKDKIFFLSGSLSVALYLIFGNNFYREIYLIGTIPFIIQNYKLNFFKSLVFLYIFKYTYLIIFFPYYYNADLYTDNFSQILIGIKSLLDFIFITALISILFHITIVYKNNFLILDKINEYK